MSQVPPVRLPVLMRFSDLGPAACRLQQARRLGQTLLAFGPPIGSAPPSITTHPLSLEDLEYLQAHFDLSPETIHRLIENNPGINVPQILSRLIAVDKVLAEKMQNAPPRRSGEPQISHPRRIARAIILDEVFDLDFLLAGLLHDAVEDNFMILEEIQSLCGCEVAGLVNSVTKLGKEVPKPERYVGSIRKLLASASKDLRAILLKVCYDNVDNWRDQRTFLSDPAAAHKPLEHAEDTFEIYAPFTDALGCWEKKVELEDKALEFHDPKYAQNIPLYNAAIAHYGTEMEHIAEEIARILSARGIKATVTYRTKYYSEVYRDCQRRKMKMENHLQDKALSLHYIAVILDEEMEKCGEANLVVKQAAQELDLFKPVPGELNNLSAPKLRGYRALHTYATLAGRPGKGQFLIGYTTEAFDRRNRLGIIAVGAERNFAPGWATTDPEWARRLSATIDRGRITGSQLRSLATQILFDLRVYDVTSGKEHRIDGNSTILDYVVVSGFCNVREITVNGEKVFSVEDRLSRQFAALRHKLTSNDRIAVVCGKGGINLHPLWLSIVQPTAAEIIRADLQTLSETNLRRCISLGIEALNFHLLLRRFLSWRDIENRTQAEAVHAWALAECSEEHIATIRQALKLARKERPSLPLLVGRGEVEVECVINTFDAVFKASLEQRRQAGNKGHGFAISCYIDPGKDRPGLQGAIGRALEAIGVSIMRSDTTVFEDDSAIMIFAFMLLSSLQERQIERISRAMLKGSGGIEYRGSFTGQIKQLNLPRWRARKK